MIGRDFLADGVGKANLIAVIVAVLVDDDLIGIAGLIDVGEVGRAGLLAVHRIIGTVGVGVALDDVNEVVIEARPVLLGEIGDRGTDLRKVGVGLINICSLRADLAKKGG